MAVTSEGTEVAVECGWNGEAAMFVLDARARARLAAAFIEPGDANAGACFKRAPENGQGRVFAIKKDATLLISCVGDAISVDHESPVGWEPCLFETVPKPSETSRPWLGSTSTRKGGTSTRKDGRERGIRTMADSNTARKVLNMRDVRARLAPRTVRNVYSVVRALFRDAVLADLMEQTPAILGKYQLGTVEDADPEWRATAIYTRGEVEQLISDDRLTDDQNVWYALQALAGLRLGEAAPLRWKHYDSSLEPLGRLVIANSNLRRRTKSGVVR